MFVVARTCARHVCSYYTTPQLQCVSELHVCKEMCESSADMQPQDAIGGTEYALAKSRTNEVMQHGDTAEMNVHHVTASLCTCR